MSEVSIPDITPIQVLSVCIRLPNLHTDPVSILHCWLTHIPFLSVGTFWRSFYAFIMLGKSFPTQLHQCWSVLSSYRELCVFQLWEKAEIVQEFQLFEPASDKPRKVQVQVRHLRSFKTTTSTLDSPLLLTLSIFDKYYQTFKNFMFSARLCLLHPALANISFPLIYRLISIHYFRTRINL